MIRVLALLAALAVTAAGHALAEPQAIGCKLKQNCDAKSNSCWHCPVSCIDLRVQILDSVTGTTPKEAQANVVVVRKSRGDDFNLTPGWLKLGPDADRTFRACVAHAPTDVVKIDVYAGNPLYRNSAEKPFGAGPGLYFQFDTRK